MEVVRPDKGEKQISGWGGWVEPGVSWGEGSRRKEGPAPNQSSSENPPTQGNRKERTTRYISPFGLSFLICGMGAGGCACPTGWTPGSELAVMRDDGITGAAEGPPPQASEPC